AEDGIRDFHVTGVQTCALPISAEARAGGRGPGGSLRLVSDLDAALTPFRSRPGASAVVVDFDGTLAPIVNDPAAARPVEGSTERSEERRVGKECRSRWSADH